MTDAPTGRGRADFALPKRLLLRRPAEYQRVYRRGRRRRGQHITIIFADNGGGDTRLGISVHGVKKAVRRNRIKRLIREYFRLHRREFAPGVDIVFAVRREFTAESLAELKAIVSPLMPRPGEPEDRDRPSSAVRQAKRT